MSPTLTHPLEDPQQFDPGGFGVIQLPYLGLLETLINPLENLQQFILNLDIIL